MIPLVNISLNYLFPLVIVGSSDFQEENPLRSHSLFETKDDSSLQKVSTTCYKNEDRVTSGSNDSVSHIESFSTLEAIRLEEDYENDENYVITETDLGEISIGSEQEQQHHQDLVKTSPYASRHYRSLSSPAPFDATELNNQILNQNQLEKESDIRSDERKICKRLFSESCNRRRSYITVASNEPYEELKSPSQVGNVLTSYLFLKRGQVTNVCLICPRRHKCTRSVDERGGG